MPIASSTRIQAYQLRKGGVQARMAIFRMIAADSANNRNESTRLQPGDWRGARNWKLNGYEASFGALHQGFNGEGRARVSVWYAHTGEQFRNERDASDVISMRHTGYYCDDDQYRLCIGIVGSLTHGRFIAGYRTTDNDERVYFGDVYTDEDTAARAADSHAESCADKEREHNATYREAADLQSANESALMRLRECIALRHVACMDYVRNEIAELCETIRENRERLNGEFKNYV